MREGAVLKLLGAIRIERDEAAIPLRGSQSQLLLAYVALGRDRPIPVDELADVLWGDHPGEHWRGALRGVVAKVRSFLELLGPDAVTLVGHRGSYSLVCADRMAIDLYRAEDLEAAARVALQDGDPARAAAGASEAATILSEPLLPGVGADWLVAPRAHLAAICQRAHRTEARAWSTLGRHEVAVAAGEAAVGADPFDEASQRVLLGVHLAAGNRAAGLRAYERFRKLAATELGVAPDERTQSLYLRLLGPPPEPGSTAADDWDEPFVGRDAELAVLAEAWATARTGRRVSVALHGGAGAGKTRLALEAGRRSGATVLYGRCTSERAVPYQPFVESIGAHLATLDDDEHRLVVEGIEDALDHLVPHTRGGHREPPRRGGADTPPRSVVFDAVTTVVRRIAADPVVIVIDDVHWADGATHRLARHLLRALEDAPVLVLTTYRDDAPPDEQLARTVTELHHLGRYRTLPVAGLTREDVAHLLDAAGLDAPAAAALHQRTGGNALYVGQLIHAWKETGGGFDDATVPSTVLELIIHRVAALDAPARSALEIASVIGTTMPGRRYDTVLAIAGVPSDAVDRLVERRLLVEHDSGSLRFDHVIVRDAVYGQLPERKRRRLHGWVADAIASDPGDGDPASLAHHYEAAGNDDNVHEWYQAMWRSAVHAMQVHAYEQAETWARRILRLVERRPEAGPVADAMLLLGAAQRRAGDLAGATATLFEAHRRAMADGSSDHVADAVLELVARGARGAAVHLPDEERAALLEDAIERLGPGSPARRAALLAEHALALLLTGRTREIEASAAEAERVAAAVHQPRVDADTIVAGRLLRPTPEHASTRRQRIDSLVAAHGSTLTEEQLIRLQLWRVTDCFELGDRARLDVELASLLQMADGLDQTYWRWLATTWRALDRFVQGDEAGAEALASEALVAVSALDHPEPPLAHAIQLVGFRIRQGRGHELVDLLVDVADGAPNVPGLRCARVAALASAGRRAEARAEIDAILADDLAAIPRDTSSGPSLVCLAEACHDAGARDAAAVLLPVLTPYRGRFVTATAFGAGGACHGPYDEAVALLHRCVGDEAASGEAFDAAITACERFAADGLRRHVERRADGAGPSR